MPFFSRQSESRLITCREEIQRVMRSAIQYYDFTVIYGRRGRRIQNELFRQGFSKVRFPNSRHNQQPSMGIDICPYPIDWNDIRRFDILAGIILGISSVMGIKLRWGGDWDSDSDLNDQTFNDLGHFEMVER